MRLVILTSSRFGVASLCLQTLLESEICTVARVIVSRTLPPNRGRYLRSKARKMLKIGLFGALNGLRMRAWYDGPPTEDVAELCKRSGVAFFETDHTNGPETVRLMREAEADLGLSLGNGYIAERVFSLPKFGMINVHGERLPQYQNAQSVIWPIYNMETMTGLTVHQIDRSIDTGDILHREEFPIAFRPRLEDTVRTTTETTRRSTPAAVRHVCENYERLRAEAVPQGRGRKYTTPTIGQFLRMTTNNRKLYRAGAA